MSKKIQFLTVLGLAISCTSALSFTLKNVKAEEAKTYYVDFFTNYLRADFTLSNGFKGKGNNIVYKTIQVPENSTVSKPEDPTRRNYEFQGWFKEEACENAWNFTSDKVISNTRIFAKWGLAQAEELVEPEYTPPSTVLEGSSSEDYIIDSVMNFKIDENDEIKVPTAVFSKLENNKDNVLPLMEYRVKANHSLTATYDNKVITVALDNSDVQTIKVKDDSLNLIVDDTYENKAKNYESHALEEESYHVMLAGSSSMEFWTTYQEDLDPIVSYNHGIGGTTIEQWDEKLNQRLVFPYKPKMVVYYVGINNVINSKEGASTIEEKLKTFLTNTHNALPNTKVQYVLMNLIPNYKSYFDVIKSVNASVVEYAKGKESWLTLINPGDALLKANGEPNAAYFRTDGLHLSFYGYVVWGGIIKESILEGLENI